MDQSAEEFIKGLEAKHDGNKVVWRTYATWFANSKGVFREYGVFLYRCGDSFYYEDFERQPSFLGFAMRPGKDAKPYEKYEGGFPISDVMESRQIPQKTAERIAVGEMKGDSVKEATMYNKVFSKLVEMVRLKDGDILFFELMDRKGFLREISK